MFILLRSIDTIAATIKYRLTAGGDAVNVDHSFDISLERPAELSAFKEKVPLSVPAK